MERSGRFRGELRSSSGDSGRKEFDMPPSSR